jgi:dGTPase
MLGRLRLGHQSLRGRQYPEPAHSYRTDFHRDRDRIVHSRAFRRLEGKTQVFAAGLSDHFRNRLTHTIEVAQVARTVAVVLDLNEEYTETLALAHDLGHPPFGHSGEQELDRQMRRFGAGFEHNAHALRIVDLLEERYARFPGLNLTFEVREGIAKHSRELLPGNENSDLLPDQRPPLEAQLIDIADEIAYNTADLDDAFSSGLLAVEDIADAVPLFAALTEQVDTQFPGATPRVRFWEIQRQLMNILIAGFIDGTAARARDSAVESLDQVRALDYRLAGMTAETEAVQRQIKALLIDRVYSDKQLVHDRAVAEEKVGALFTFFLEHPRHISSGYRESLESQPVHRVVCDYIAGMTDAYFLRQYSGFLTPLTRG